MKVVERRRLRLRLNRLARRTDEQKNHRVEYVKHLPHQIKPRQSILPGDFSEIICEILDGREDLILLNRLVFKALDDNTGDIIVTVLGAVFSGSSIANK